MRIIAALLVSLASTGAATAQTATELAYGRQADWQAVSGRINLSTFVYLDANESGLYDLGDRPMAAVFSALAKDGDGVAASMSNANGFGNFVASASDEKAVIRGSGTYTFQIMVPPGWRATSGNDAQVIEVAGDPGWLGGNRLTEMLEPVGLAPIRAIHGTWGGAEAVSVSISRDGEPMAETRVEPGARFGFLPSRPGVYTIAAGDISREVALGFYPVEIGTLRQGEPMARALPPIGFEDLSPNGLLKVPNGYGGLQWRDLNMIRRDFTKGSQGYVNGATSGDRTAYTTNTRPGQILSEVPFDLISVNLTAAWREAEGQIAVIEAWRGEEKIAEDRVPLSVLGPVSYSPGLRGITRMQVTPEHGWQIVVDDVVVGR